MDKKQLDKIKNKYSNIYFYAILSKDFKILQELIRKEGK